MSKGYFTKIIKMLSEEVPRFIEKKGTDIIYFGDNNLFPYELIDLYNDSSTHNAIINGKVGYTVGNGLVSDNVNTKNWLKNPNLNSDWNTLLKQISLDYELFNGYCIEVTRTRSGKLYNHVDFANIRVRKDGDLEYSDEWITDKGKKNYKPATRIMQKYDPNDDSQKISLVYHTDYRPNFKYYPLPVYIGSLAEIKTDVSIGDYWLNEVESGFSVDTLIVHKNGVPETDEEKEDFEKAFGRKFSGTDGKKLAHIFAPSGDTAAEVIKLEGSNTHERYVEMSKRVKESIFIGHRVTNPILFGVKEQGQLGARNELDLAYEIFTNTYIQERRNTILTTINKLAKIDGFNGKIEVQPLKPVDNLDLTSDIIISNLTNLEIREIISDRTGIQIKTVQEPLENNTSLSKFSDDDVIKSFEKIGVPASNYEIVDSKDIQYSSAGTPIEFASDLTEDIKEILSIIVNSSIITATGITEATDLKIEEVLVILEGLKNSELINVNGSEITPTRSGKRAYDDINVTKAIVKYRYEVRSDAPPLKGGKSRPFCSKMMAMDKLYTREEINMLRNGMDADFSNASDVWLARGGWYRRPNEEVSVPYCRHVWKQVLVREKK